MAEAESAERGGPSGGLIFLIIIIFIVLWLRQGGWERLRERPIDFGWRPASTTEAFPFAPNVGKLAPGVSVPSGPRGPQPPAGPQDTYGPN